MLPFHRLAQKSRDLVAQRRPLGRRVRGDRPRKDPEHDEGGVSEEGGSGGGVHLPREQQQRHAAGHQHGRAEPEP